MRKFKNSLCAAVGTDGINCHIWKGYDSAVFSVAKALLLLSFSSLGGCWDFCQERSHCNGLAAEVGPFSHMLWGSSVGRGFVNQYSFSFWLSLKHWSLVLLINGTSAHWSGICLASIGVHVAYCDRSVCLMITSTVWISFLTKLPNCGPCSKGAMWAYFTHWLHYRFWCR